jgi:hypothetical protein
MTQLATRFATESSRGVAPVCASKPRHATQGGAACGALAVALCFLTLSATVCAEERAAPSLTENEPISGSLPSEGKEAERVSVGARTFVGVVAEGDEVKPAFGGGFLLGVPVYEQFEIEGGFLLAAMKDTEPFLVTELIAKWVPEVDAFVAPHFTLGPVISVDFANPVAVSGGAVAGVGATWWVNRRVGWVTDLSYRLLLGAEVGQVGALSFGLVYRPE